MNNHEQTMNKQLNKIAHIMKTNVTQMETMRHNEKNDTTTTPQ